MCRINLEQNRAQPGICCEQHIRDLGLSRFVKIFGIKHDPQIEAALYQAHLDFVMNRTMNVLCFDSSAYG